MAAFFLVISYGTNTFIASSMYCHWVQKLRKTVIYQFTKLVLYCNTTQPVTKLRENFVFCR